MLTFLVTYGPFFGILAAVATIAGFLFRLYMTSHNKHVSALQDQLKQSVETIGQLQNRLKPFDEADVEGLKALAEDRLAQVQQAKSTEAEIRANLAEAEAANEQAKAELLLQIEKANQAKQALSADLEAAQEALAERDQLETTRTNLVKKALKMEGRIWERKVLSGVPAFKPLHERHVPIVSVLNLKGGVGKTTVTSHLGAALAGKGYRVLLGDLDLQGSLSSLFVNETVLAERSEASQLLQHFLLGASERKKCNLLDFTVPIFDGKSAIIPTADSMSYAELNLTMRWLLRIGKKDNRFLLRRALQQKRITRRFDVVLLDCPPIFNTCCVNALAASDYLIIPVTPSKKTAERVPLLLHRLKGLCQVVNHNLQVAGILLNRTYGAQLTGWERTLWDEIQQQALDRWKMPVPVFTTFIPHTTEVRENETEFCSPEKGTRLHSLFSQLAAELEERLPGDCRRTANAAHGPE
jgi:cellulose biosynthesis protein BcsQ